MLNKERRSEHLSFVESSEMKNVYDGVAQLDEDGTATEDLPEWFEALNEDFRYQLTAVGGVAPNLHVVEEISENRSRIAGGEEGMKVCWQVTGSRKDVWAAANSLEVEEAKPPEERGRYLHPELYNAPEEQKISLVPMQEAQYRPEMPPRVEEPPQVPPPPPSFVLDELDRLKEQIEELREELWRRKR
jgi:hypothetical protein